MPAPLILGMTIPEAIGVGSTLLGGLGTLFGGGQKTELPPQLQQIFRLLEKRAGEGLSDEEESLLTQRLKGNLSSEFGALSSMMRANLQRSGAGVGVQQAAASDLNSKRLNALGEGITNIGIMDQQARSSALSQLAGLSGQLGQYTRQTGQGYQELLGFGINQLLEKSRHQRQLDLLEAINGTRVE